MVSSKIRARVLGLVKSARSEIYCLFLSLVVTENVIGGFSENGKHNKTIILLQQMSGWWTSENREHITDKLKVLH